MATAPVVFLELAGAVRALIASDEAAQRWDEPSSLPGMAVADLCGHLVRVTSGPLTYLDGGEAHGDPVSAAVYYVNVMGDDPADPSSETNRGVRSRSRDLAAGGRDAVVARVDDAIARFTELMDEVGPDDLIEVFGGNVMRLEDYLLTRILEFVVHIDDLATSLGVDLPRLPSDAYDATIAVLIGIARLRHGDAAVVRAMTRRERDDVAALRVF